MNSIIKFRYFAHALVRMKERGISKADIERAYQFPDKIEHSIRERNRFLIKKVYHNKLLARDHLLMIVFEKTKKEMIIVTVIDTSKISKYF